MIRPICKDVFFLSKPSVPAGREDLATATDLLDTLRAHADECVGMAANMIGVNKNIIVVTIGFANMILMNPVITQKSSPFSAEEGCLSLEGIRKTTRYQRITVEYQDMDLKKHVDSFEGWTAQIIQHEVDHLSGIII